MDFLQNPTHQARIQALSPPMLAVLTLATVQPLVVIMITAMPFRPGDTEWRIRLFALLLGATPQIVIALVVIAAIGLFSERLLAVRITAVLALAIAIALVPILVIYTLDTIELHPFIAVDQVRRYKYNALQSAGIAALMIPLLVWLGRRGLAAGRRLPFSTSDAGHDIVVGREPGPTGPLDPRVTN